MTTKVLYIITEDCFRCDYSQGQMWLQYRPNCHQFYVCKPNGKGGYIKYLMTCGALFWNQALHTCTDVKTGLCYVDDPVAYTGPPIVDGVSLFYIVYVPLLKVYLHLHIDIHKPIILIFVITASIEWYNTAKGNHSWQLLLWLLFIRIDYLNYFRYVDKQRCLVNNNNNRKQYLRTYTLITFARPDDLVTKRIPSRSHGFSKHLIDWYHK